MTAIFLSVFAVIGKLLLVLAVLLLLILFFPVLYRAEIHIHEGLSSLNVSASLLLILFRAVLHFEKTDNKKETAFSVRIAGIPLQAITGLFKKKRKSGRQAGKTERQIRTEAPRKPTVPPGQRQSPSSPGTVSVEVTKARHPELAARVGARISAFAGRIKELYRKFSEGAGIFSDWAGYLGTESFGRAKERLLHEGSAILRHVLPTKAEGSIRFGTDDPANTGLIFGIASLLYPVFPEKLTVEPVFTGSVLDTDLLIKGRVILFVVVIRIVRILACRDVRKLIGRIMKTIKTLKKKQKAESIRKGRGKTWRKTKKTMHFRTT